MTQQKGAKGKKRPPPGTGPGSKSTQFKKGKPGGPGRSRLTPEVKKATKFTRDMVQLTMSKMLTLSEEELDEFIDNKENAMFDIVVARILKAAGTGADQSRLNFLLERTVGKVKDVQEIILPTPTVITRPSGEVVTAGVVDMKKLKESDDIEE